MLDRLQTVLTAVRYEPNAKPGIRINLLFALKAHAILIKDVEFENACDAEIDKIHAEQRASQAGAETNSPKSPERPEQ